MTKQQILTEIRRTAAENGGAPLGVRRFESQTGIRQGDWFGIHWRSWGDAVREAGLEPNLLNTARGETDYLESYTLLARELGRAPVKGDLRLKKRRDPSFPSDSAFARRFGSYSALRARAYEYSKQRAEFDDVLPLLEPLRKRRNIDSTAPSLHTQSGYVYLLKHGSRSEYKIGKTMNPLRREGELRLQLPERIKPVHYIETDDPSGVEHYWQKRFKAKRKEGEWFALNADDIRAFKRWKRIF